MSTDTDYYELLEIERGANDAAIKSAYRKLAMKFHPDKNGGCKDHESKFKAVSEAYECLKDPQKRAAYDRFGKAAFQNGGPGHQQAGGFEGFSDIFDSIFGMGRQQGSRGSQRGADLRYDLEIGLDDAYHGKATEVSLEVSTACGTCAGTGAKAGAGVRACNTCAGMGKVRAQQGFFVVERTCPTCHGAGEIISDPCEICHGDGRVDRQKTLSVNIPPGVDEGTRIRLTGEGECGPRGAPCGDLYIFLHVKQHDFFEREGTTLYARCPISFTTASLGGTIDVPGLDKKVHEIRIPAGIQSGKQLRQRGAGMPVLNARGHGDMVVQIEVETPTKLSSKQKQLLEEFRATETGEECPQSRGLFDKLKSALGG